MAIEDFEWEGELTAAPGARRPRVGTRSPWAWFSRLRQSVWLEPALRLIGTLALLGVLAGIGVLATTYAKPGYELPQGSRPLVAALGTSWLKPTPSAVAGPSSAVAALPTTLVVGAAPPVTTASVTAAPAPSEEPQTPGQPAGVTADGKVVLNVASAVELTQLPGVGMKRAQAIVALRTKLKRFKSPTDLLRVKGIGPRGLQRMLPHLVLDAP
jgi:competence protein ComEA